MRIGPAILLIYTLVGLASVPVRAADHDANSTGPFNARIVEFCQENLGKQLGNGQCTAVANLSLRAAGAKVRPRRDFPEPGDYVWGKEICLLEGTPYGTRVVSGSLDDVRPGDVAQFRNVKFVSVHASHHTAVVEYVNPKRIGFFQQNMRGVLTMTKGAVTTANLHEGWIRFYRPVAQ